MSLSIIVISVKIDPRIDDRVQQVADQPSEERNQTADKDQRHEHVVVSIESRLKAEQSDAVEIEQAFDDQRPGQKHAEETPQTGHNGNQSIAQGVLENHDLFVESFGTRRADVVELDL